MKKVIRIRHGEPIPPNSRHLTSVRELDHENRRAYFGRPARGWRGLVPFPFSIVEDGFETPYAMFHYYEVEDDK